jgi:hypothetical protein
MDTLIPRAGDDVPTLVFNPLGLGESDIVKRYIKFWLIDS